MDARQTSVVYHKSAFEILVVDLTSWSALKLDFKLHRFRATLIVPLSQLFERSAMYESNKRLSNNGSGMRNSQIRVESFVYFHKAERKAFEV